MNDKSKCLVAQLLSRLGDKAVLLPVKWGEKGPYLKAWQKLTPEDMTTEYLEAISSEDNVGVLLGKASGGLVTIDLDDDEAADRFLELNPGLRGTLRTKGARGCNFWLRVKGACPPLSKISHRETGQSVGEWRSDGGQTIIWGQHPSGCQYRRIVRANPLEVEFGSINWPPEWDGPWSRRAEDELVRQHGEPFTVAKSGAIHINQLAFVMMYKAERPTMWVPEEGQFYEYQPVTGLWTRVTVEQVKFQFGLDLKRFADQVEVPAILKCRTELMLRGLTEMLKGPVERKQPFERKRNLIHLQNGVLDLSVSPPVIRPFSPDFYSRNRCSIDFLDNAECPVFLNDLLGQALSPEDISLLQRVCGAVLLGRNAAQKILLILGTAGGGKSTLVEILETVIGAENVAELRTELLYERFEVSRFIGKTLLTGKDVPGEFLTNKGASALKKLVGHDLLSAELKGVNASVPLRGDFSVICTCNGRMRVRLESDTDAWRRRLLIIEYNRPKPERPIRDFGRQLLEKEGPGILRWMVEGAVLHLHELQEHGDFVLSPAQRRRVDDLLNESDSVRHFLRERIQLADGFDITTDELVEAYHEFCESKAWRGLSIHQVREQLPDLMLEIHRVSMRHDLKRAAGKPVRGYSGVALCPSNNPF